ncbi:MAG TPA: hypothetical protein VMQ76_13685, partial [Terracidiphilus sp.]|nr:hypothetical protein [Terracidiphilus sp.]
MAEYPSSLPWLKPPDPAAHLLEGFKAGAQISEANARLAESARTADIGFSLDQERLQQQSRKEQQQLEVQRAYHQQTTALKTQQLQQAKEVNDARISQAAQKYGQQQEIQKRAADIHAAVDAETITKEEGDNQIARLAVETSMGTPQGPTALRAAQAAEPAQAPQITKSPQGQELFYGKPGTFKLGTSTGTGSDKAATAMDMADYRSTLSQLAAIRR